MSKEAGGIGENQAGGKDARGLLELLKSRRFQLAALFMLIVVICYAIILNGATPQKYDLKLNEISKVDITASRDVENYLKTEELAEAAAEELPAVMKRLDSVSVDTLNKIDNFFNTVELARKNLINNNQISIQNASEELNLNLQKNNILLSQEQITYLISKIDAEVFLEFEKNLKSSATIIVKSEITKDNLVQTVKLARYNLGPQIGENEAAIAEIVLEAVLEPNIIIDYELTDAQKQQAYDLAMENKQMITEGSRILSVGDVVSEDKLEVLKSLNLIETGKPDYKSAFGILAAVFFLSFTFLLYMHFFYRKLMSDRSAVILLGLIITAALFLARVLNLFNPYFIPVFLAPMLIAILIDMRLAIMANLILAFAVGLMTGFDYSLLIITVIIGTLSVFLVSKAVQRSKLSLSGLAVGALAALLSAALGAVNNLGLNKIAFDGLILLINGIATSIFIIGIMPFFEALFNIVTPQKLLELSNPNLPLFKRMLIEAPGTYHHSLMVGNLSEAAADSIGANFLLARVGAYYHDIGKLARPVYFKENQIGENPHDKMDPEISTSIITSHTVDGVQLAESYKIPSAIQDIIAQHHGTTLVSFFYHKAKNLGKAEDLCNQEFRYAGPKPDTREAAVVMLADSAEAAVRAMPDKTKEKIEIQVRKIIKDKLDDGQFDFCELTLKDLDLICNAFLVVFGGYFHQREVYPDSKRSSVEINLSSESALDEPVRKIEFNKTQLVEDEDK